MKNDDIVIVAATRTPMAGLLGGLASVSATELGAVTTRAVMSQSGLKSDAVDEVMFGNVLPAGLGQAPTRQVALGADLDLSTSCTTISKVCGSGMQAVISAHDSILAGTNEVVIAGGMESMSRAPYMQVDARAGLRAGHKELKDHMFYDGLEDAYTGSSMGSFAQATADEYNVTREQMDAYAIESLSRANTAIENGYFKDEITPVSVKTRSGTVEVTVDEQPGKAKVDKIPQLRPAFSKDGTITAANSSSISDGAAALLVMTQSKADSFGLKPLARIVAHASHAQQPNAFCLAPIGAVRKLLSKLDWSLDDIDLFEINEAFAMVPMIAAQQLEVSLNKVNVNGGACALGHPIGSSGARIIVTLIYALKRLNKKRGVASLCIGGGEGTAVAIELV